MDENLFWKHAKWKTHHPSLKDVMGNIMRRQLNPPISHFPLMKEDSFVVIVFHRLGDRVDNIIYVHLFEKYDHWTYAIICDSFYIRHEVFLSRRHLQTTQVDISWLRNVLIISPNLFHDTNMFKWRNCDGGNIFDSYLHGTILLFGSGEENSLDVK